MLDEELMRRAAARLAEVEENGDYAPVLTPEALSDAVRLLADVAEAPDRMVQFGPLLLVLGTHWYRAGAGERNPEAEEDANKALVLRALLQRHLDDPSVLPPLAPGFEEPEVDPLALLAGFASIVAGSCHSLAVEALEHEQRAEAAARYEQGLAWLYDAYQVTPVEHESFGDLSVMITVLNMERFEKLADPEGLAAAAPIAARACLHVTPEHPRQGENLPHLLDAVVRAALLLGAPPLDDLDELIRQSRIDPKPPTAQVVARLRELRPQPGSSQAEIDLSMAFLLYADAADREDLPTIACTVVRLRRGLAELPASHHMRGTAVLALRAALAILGVEAEDAADDLEIPEPSDNPTDQLNAAVLRYIEICQRAGSERAGELSVLLDRILMLGDQLAVRGGLPGLPAELRVVVAFADSIFEMISREDPADRPDERIARYLAAYRSLPADLPVRGGYGVLLAAIALKRAETAAPSDPARAVELRTLVSVLEADLAAILPADSVLFHWLRTGETTAAIAGAFSELSAAPWPAEAAAALTSAGGGMLISLAEGFIEGTRSIKDGLGGDTAGLAAMLRLATGDQTGKHDLAAGIGDLELALDRLSGDPDTVARLRGAGGDLISALLGTTDLGGADPDLIVRAAQLLRDAYEHAEKPSPAVAERFPELLAMLGAINSDPALVMEGAAVFEATAEAGPASIAGQSSAMHAFRAAHFRVLTNLQSYVLAHDPGQLDRAKRAVPELIELGAQVDAEQGGGVENRVFAEAIRDLIDVLGPGGGPGESTDAVLEQCRRTFRSAPAGPRRSFAGNTLIRALLIRAMPLRESDPQYAARLLDEAEEVLDAFAVGESPAIVAMIRGNIGLHRSGPGGRIDPRYLAGIGEAVAAAESEAGLRGSMTGTAGRMVHSMLSRFNGADPQETTVASLRDPSLSTWLRAHSGIAAAVGVSNAPDADAETVDLSLGYAAETVDLLERLTDRGGSGPAAEHGLSAFDGDIRDVATFLLFKLMIWQGPPEAAHPDEDGAREISGRQVDDIVALHERGRGLLLARRLESRADLSGLRKQHPKLAAAFERLTASLEAGAGTDSDRARLDGLRTSRELDALIEHIRAQRGFEYFLGSLTPEQLRELSAQGPIVVLNHTKSMQCVAFIVGPEGIVARRLGIMGEDVTRVARQLREAIEKIYARGADRPPPAELIAARGVIDAVLAWTWHTIVEPVLDRLGHHAPIPPGAAWPRIWWVPTGPFNALPLQAAQCTNFDHAHDADHCGGALDRVVSSFIPGFQTLAYARARAARVTASTARRALVVSESDDVLPGALAAATCAVDALGAANLLVGEDATRAAVIEALENAPWVQFGCHAHSSADQPAGSWIQLPAEERLSVSDICRIRPDSARLAVLTACGTARSAEKLADEAVNVSSAFLLAGYPESVGTLWEVESLRIEAFLRGFYSRRSAQHAQSAPATAATSAYALHEAVRELRDRAPERPHVWAAYIHAGV